MTENDVKIQNQASASAEQVTEMKQSGIARVADLYRLLGDAVLLPVPKGEKGCRILRWNKTTFEKTQKEPLKFLIETADNHAVLLGGASGGLCAIDVDSDAEVEPFLNLNPKLELALRTRGARGCQIWVRVKGSYPKITTLKTADGKAWGEWRSDGGTSIISGIHPEGMTYKRIVNQPPMEIEFDEIKWPEGLVLPWTQTPEAKLVHDQGHPFVTDEEGRIIGGLNEMYFVEYYRRSHDVLYDQGAASFFEYDPDTGLWKGKSELEIRAAYNRDFTSMAQSLENAFTRQDLLRMRGTKLFAPMVSSLKASTLKIGAFSEKPSAIHVRNGMLELNESGWQLVDFSPKYYSRNLIPFDYDADAECPKFLNNLLLSALEPEDISLLQRWCGSVLLGTNAAQKIMLLTGAAGGGKSTLISVIEEIIGRDNVASFRANHLSKQFELAAFEGRTLLTGKDVPGNFMLNRGIHQLKALVGNDYIHAERKGANDRVGMKGNFNVVITSNDDLKITLENDEDAWTRRLMVIRYEKGVYSQRIPDFDKILIREEASGILRWMVEGALAHKKELREKGTYELTQNQMQRITDMVEDSNQLKQFIGSKVVPFPGGNISSEELITAVKATGVGESHGKLRQIIPSLMQNIHGASTAHNIIREGVNVRGFNGFSLKPGEQNNAS